MRKQPTPQPAPAELADAITELWRAQPHKPLTQLLFDAAWADTIVDFLYFTDDLLLLEGAQEQLAQADPARQPLDAQQAELLDAIAQHRPADVHLLAFLGTCCPAETLGEWVGFTDDHTLLEAVRAS